MTAPLFQVDAFTKERFKGNPAAVVVLDEFLDDSLLQAIAAENNLAETAFVVDAGETYRIRWFTPTTEVPLCGHATLASAAVVFERLSPASSTVTFESASGPLHVRRRESTYVMDFPTRRCEPAIPPDGFSAALAAEPVETVWDGFNFLARLGSSDMVRTLAPSLTAIADMPCSGVIVTAMGDGRYDFVSRYFAPSKGIPEDPVTGGAHCALTPYWADRLAKTELMAYQASQRGGEIICRLKGDRVELEGSCVFFLEGVALW